MPPPLQMPYQDRERSPTPWVALFVLLSILAHVIVLCGVVLLAIFVPAPKLEPPPHEKTPVTLSLMPAPQPPPKPIPPKERPFLPTLPQRNVPHKETLAQSANDSLLTSPSKTAREPNSVIADVQTDIKHGAIIDSPDPLSAKKRAAPPTTIPPKPSDQPPQPQPSTTPPQPPKPTPPKPPTPQVVKNPVDPVTGLPVLPPINAPTLAPQSAQQPSKSSATHDRPMVAEDTKGRLGLTGAPSPEAMATAMGKYQTMVYNAVGSRWGPKTIAQLQLLSVGTVRVQYTIYSDGTVTTKILDDGGASMQLLLAISVNSIRESAPFRPFDQYPGLREELIKTQGGNGDSFTSEFDFSLYSP